VSYASPLIRKLHLCGGVTSKTYKPAFYSSHLSHNMSYGGVATLWVFRFPQRGYSYSTQSSMMELLLSVSQHWNLCLVLQLRNLSVGLGEEPCIEFIQENSIENSVQDGLPYIQIPNGLCELFLTYPKQPCVCLKVNMFFTCGMTSFFQNLLPSSMCYVTCDHVIWCDLLCNSMILSL